MANLLAAKDPPAMEQRVTLITLHVADLARARAFYEGLGWGVTAEGAGEACFFQLGPLGLCLLGRAAYLREMAGDADHVPPGPSMLAHNVFHKADVDTLLSFALTQGGRLVRPAAEQFWGGYSGMFADPDGHYWEIAYNPYWPLADDGRVTIA
ncbi:VOC family protein [Niveispirillum sp. BGYR6]|uniref:VOC family protein n=2 Tax=Azospirillaceae TaxID=2829815 RepID=UPI0022B964E7|nr:VOC family protein [Niveispirillum sp. BGYR6]MDG5495485.1 VOC family protein [Niveispirillum sp. BGYR6]